MREGNLDCDQDLDLTMFILEVEEVVREIMEDPRFKGHQHYKMKVDADDGKQL